MELYEVFSALSQAPGVTGREGGAAAVAEEYFSRLSDKVWRDNLGNVFCSMGEGKPVVLVAAHMDEIGMVVTDIEENGMLRIRSVAGVDPRVLPGSSVRVCSRSGDIPAVVGAVPPHLLDADKAKKAYEMKDLLVDTGLSPAHVRERVRVGDFVTFAPEAPLKLMNNRIAGKTLDDRALVCTMMETMELLSRRKLSCTAVFCATVQEERGSFGALTGSFGVRPDIGLALDVTHAPTPGTDAFDTAPMDKLELARGSDIHAGVYAMLAAAAKEANIDTVDSASMGRTYTDADELQISGPGVPTGLISVPIRYMHTSVESGSLDTLHSAARLVAEFIAGIGGDWEDGLCLPD